MFKTVKDIEPSPVFYGWYNKCGSYYSGLYVSSTYVDGDEWFLQGYDPVTGEFVEDKKIRYDGATKYFAITIGWDENG